MDIVTPQGTTNTLNAPKDWDESGAKAEHGECRPLPIIKLGSVLWSFWQPNPDELALLNAGHPIALGIIQGFHPPVIVSVANETTDTIQGTTSQSERSDS